ncbi:MAG TPA: glycosyltransferase family 4 protein [Solirubrobacteraceae bacterium]|nr:glycosyltransferase family 4 protein [Solirubrobacteraceae bacterium]
MATRLDPLRVAVLPPAPAAYREPLFEALAARPDIELSVIYQSRAPAGWEGAPGFFPTAHRYPAVHLRARQRARPGRSPIVVPSGVEAALRTANPDVVIAVEYGPTTLRALAWSRLHRRGFVIFSDCTPEIDRLLSPGQLTLHRLLARHADHMIAVSGAGRARLEAFGVAPERIVLAPQQGDLEPIRAVAARASDRRGAGGSPAARRGEGFRPPGPIGLPTGSVGPGVPGPFVVASAGRLVPDKNFAALIEAAARADPTRERLALRIAGTGFEEPELRALAAERGVPVEFLGAVPPAAMGDLYARADAFALVSTFEPFGVVVREAVAAGLPIVCSRRAGAAGDIAVEGRNALLVDPEDVGQIAAALGRLARDAGLRAALAAGSRELDAENAGADIEAFAAAARAAAARRGRQR